MNNFIKKIAEVEKSLSEDKGNFKLFAVFSRPDTEGRWDIVISADWIKSEREGLDYISKKLTKNLSPEEIIKISRIVYLNVNDNFVRVINSAFSVKNHNLTEIENCDINGILVSKGYVFASQHWKDHPTKKPRSSHPESIGQS